MTESYPFGLSKEETELLIEDFRKIKGNDNSIDINKVIAELDKTDSAVKCPLAYNFYKSMNINDFISNISQLQYFDYISDTININKNHENSVICQEKNEKDTFKKTAENFFDSFLDLENLGFITKEKFYLIWNSSSIGR